MPQPPAAPVPVTARHRSLVPPPTPEPPAAPAPDVAAPPAIPAGLRLPEAVAALERSVRSLEAVAVEARHLDRARRVRLGTERDADTVWRAIGRELAHLPRAHAVLAKGKDALRDVARAATEARALVEAAREAAEQAQSLTTASPSDARARWRARHQRQTLDRRLRALGRRGKALRRRLGALPAPLEALAGVLDEVTVRPDLVGRMAQSARDMAAAVRAAPLPRETFLEAVAADGKTLRRLR